MQIFFVNQFSFLKIGNLALSLRKPEMCNQFFSKQTCLKNKFAILLTNEKEKAAMSDWQNDDDIL